MPACIHLAAKYTQAIEAKSAALHATYCSSGFGRNRLISVPSASIAPAPTSVSARKNRFAPMNSSTFTETV